MASLYSIGKDDSRGKARFVVRTVQGNNIANFGSIEGAGTLLADHDALTSAMGDI